MIRYYKTVEGKTTRIKNYCPECWINCVNPDEEEINFLISELSVEPEFVRSSLDEEESSHIDIDDGKTLMTIDSPIVDKSGNNFTYYTLPLSIIITPTNIITISIKENAIINEFAEGLIKNVTVEDKNKFALQIMLRAAGKYLLYLKQINKITERVEEKLKKTMRNDQLIQFLEIEKSLVYFSASLKSISGMIGKINRGKYIKLNDEARELLEDIKIEFTQATEMTEIYLNILSSTMGTFESLISNNLNDVMKILASITLVLSIPTIISGIYGMNNPGIPLMDNWIAPFVMMAVGCVAAWLLLKRKNMI